MKKQGNMPSLKDSNFILTKIKGMKFCKLDVKEFRITILNEPWENSRTWIQDKKKKKKLIQNAKFYNEIEYIFKKNQA